MRTIEKVFYTFASTEPQVVWWPTTGGWFDLCYILACLQRLVSVVGQDATNPKLQWHDCTPTTMQRWLGPIVRRACPCLSHLKTQQTHFITPQALSP